MKRDTTSVTKVDDIPTEYTPQGIGIFSKVLHRDQNFRYPHRMLAEATFPDVGGTLTSFTLLADQSKLTDSITVTTLPPQSVLEDIERELRRSEEELGRGAIRNPSYGVFDINGIRNLQVFHRLKCPRADVSFEKQWINK